VGVNDPYVPDKITGQISSFKYRLFSRERYHYASRDTNAGDAKNYSQAVGRKSEPPDSSASTDAVISFSGHREI
jgi:hypothetical protein